MFHFICSFKYFFDDIHFDVVTFLDDVINGIFLLSFRSVCYVKYVHTRNE